MSLKVLFCILCVALTAVHLTNCDESVEVEVLDSMMSEEEEEPNLSQAAQPKVEDPPMLNLEQLQTEERMMEEEMKRAQNEALPVAEMKIPTSSEGKEIAIDFQDSEMDSTTLLALYLNEPKPESSGKEDNKTTDSAIVDEGDVKGMAAMEDTSNETNANFNQSEPNDLIIGDRTARKEEEDDEQNDEIDGKEMDKSEVSNNRRIIVASLNTEFGAYATRSDGNNSVDDDSEGHRAQTDVPIAEDFISKRVLGYDEDELEPIDQSAHQDPKQPTLTSWLLDPWIRQPLAVLVPMESETLQKAADLWRQTEDEAEAMVNRIDILLVAYDSAGIQLVFRHGGASARKGQKSISSILAKLKPTENIDQARGTYSAIRDSATLVPYDSAVILLTDRISSEQATKMQAAGILLNKRIKLLTIWMDPASTEKAEDLRQFAISTGGDLLMVQPILRISGREAPSIDDGLEESKLSMAVNDLDSQGSSKNMDIEDGYKKQLLVLRKSAKGHTAIAVPVDSTVAELNVRVNGKVERAAFYPPTGPLIDLANATSVSEFSLGSGLLSTEPLEASLLLKGTSGRAEEDRYSVVAADAPDFMMPQEVNVKGMKSSAGVWRLSVRCDGCKYDIAIYAITGLTFEAIKTPQGKLKLTLHGPMASVRETNLINDKGVEIAKIPFRYQQQAGEDGAYFQKSLMREVMIPDYRSVDEDVGLYVQVVGRDYYGESFARMSGPLNPYRRSKEVEIFPPSSLESKKSAIVNNQELFDVGNQPSARQQQFLDNSTINMQVTSTAGDMLTGLQVGSATKLFGSPGETIQLHFEVTNYRQNTVRFQFGATSNQYFLRNLLPTTQNINAGQMVNVILTVGITTSAQVGVRDEITFVATGLDQVSVSAVVYVITPAAATSGSLVAGFTDRWPPQMWHSFTGDCMGIMADCSQRLWSVTFFVKDIDSGLLRVATTPAGLRFDRGFIAGTKDEVRATYRNTCCNPVVLVSAVDIFGNINTYTVDASQYFTPAAIAAIVLGVILFLAILIVIIVGITICVRRRRRSRDMPSYQSSRQVRET